MKKGFYLILLLALTLITTQFSCKSISKSNKNSSKNLKAEDFKTFVERFKTDSTFQFSRIVFPLTQESSGDMDDVGKKIDRINSNDWRYLSLKYNQSFATRELDAYTEQIVNEKNTSHLLYQGVNNGINVEFVFELKNKKWYLIRWNDFSN